MIFYIFPKNYEMTSEIHVYNVIEKPTSCDYVSRYYKMLFVHVMGREKELYKYLEKNNWRNPNGLKIPNDFLLKHIEKPWNFHHLSSNPFLDLKIVEEFPTKGWIFGYFHENVNFNWEFFSKFSDKQWNLFELSSRVDFPLKFLTIIQKDIYNWKMLSQRSNIPLKILFEFANQWDYRELQFRNNIPLIFLEKTVYKNWDFSELSGSPLITPEFVMKYPKKDWVLADICRNYPEYKNELLNFFRNELDCEYGDVWREWDNAMMEDFGIDYTTRNNCVLLLENEREISFRDWRDSL